MFGWFGEVGRRRKIIEFSLFGREKSQKTTKIIFEFLTLVNRHRFFFFIPETLNPIFLENTKKTRAGT